MSLLICILAPCSSREVRIRDRQQYTHLTGPFRITCPDWSADPPGSLERGRTRYSRVNFCTLIPALTSTTYTEPSAPAAMSCAQ